MNVFPTGSLIREFDLSSSWTLTGGSDVQDTFDLTSDFDDTATVNMSDRVQELLTPGYIEPAIDWIMGTTLFPNKETLRKFVHYLELICEDSWMLLDDRPIAGGKLWPSSGFSILGGRIGYELLPSGMWSVWISLPGNCLTRNVGLRTTWLLLKGLAERWRFGFTRIDCKIRDYSKTITPELCLEAAKAGNVTGFEPKSKTGLVTYTSFKDGRESLTVNMGSNQSDTTTCCYNALVKHEVDATDYECRHRDKKAQAVADLLTQIELLGCDDDLVASMVANIAIGQVNFLDRSDPSIRPARCSPLPWWKLVKSVIGDGLKISCGSAPPTLERIKDWIKTQVAGSLAALKQILDDTFEWWLMEVIDEAKISPPLQLLIRHHRPFVEKLGNLSSA